MKSKLIILPLIFISLPLLIPFALLGLPKIYSTIYQLKNGLSNEISGILIPIIYLLLTFYLFKIFINLFPKLTMNENGIKLSSISKDSIYRWEEIEKIDLTGKKEFMLLIPRQMEAVTFYLKNGGEKIFWIDQYSNSSDIRLYLEKNQKKLITKPHILNNVNSNSVVENIQTVEIKLEDKLYNDDNLLTEDRIFIYIIFLINLVFISINFSKLFEYYTLIIFSICSSLILIYIFSYHNNYFTITEKSIIVKNNILYLKQKKYNIINVKEIAIEQHKNTGIMLRIITKEYETHIIGASSLKKNTWEELINDLSKKNILIRNEIKK